jgi:hypothetical protein
VPDKRGAFNGSMQHLLEVYLQGFQNPRSFAGVDLDAWRSRPVRIARSRADRFSWGSIFAADRLVFSLVPRCQGLCGSQKYIFTFVATVKVLCLAISSPRSQVNERRRDTGSLRICRLRAATTTAVSLLLVNVDA